MSSQTLIIILVIIAASVGTAIFLLSTVTKLVEAGSPVEMIAPCIGIIAGSGGLYWLFSVIVKELHRL